MLDELLKEECRKRKLRLESLSYRRDPADGSVRAYFLSPAQETHATIVFCHGFGNDALFPQMPLLLKLAESGYAVLTFDLDGHGVGSSTKLYPEHLLSCIADAVAFARSRVPQQALHLVGHSLGALLCLHTSVQANLNVRSMILISMPTDLRFSTSILFSEAVLTCMTGSFFRALGFFKTKFLPALGPLGRSRFPLRFTTKTREEGAKALAETVSIWLGTYLRAPVPTLYIYGSWDKITPLRREALVLGEGDEVYCVRSETHLSTGSSRRVESKILNWLEAHI